MSPSDDNTFIIVDDRELGEHPNIPELLKYPTKIERLEAGDYAFLDINKEPIGIERSEITNLLQKMKTGELESQLERCDEYYSHFILLVEGVYDEVGNYLSVYRQTNTGYYRRYVSPVIQYPIAQGLLTRLLSIGIPIIHSANFECSMKTINVIVSHLQKPEERHSLFLRTKVVIPTKLTRNPAVPRLMYLCPRMPEKVAIALINKYGSIWGVLQQPDSELRNNNMGNILIRRLRDNVGYESPNQST